MPPMTPSSNGSPPGEDRRYWRSLNELAGTMRSPESPGLRNAPVYASRRSFLRLMGASLGLAGLSGCIRWPKEDLAPYAHRPANRMPGETVSYATAMELGGVGQGLLVTSFDGRPIKIEGNPTHPLNRGAADAIAQASVLEVYDPDRSRGVIRREGGSTVTSSWVDFSHWARRRFAGDGAGVCVLSESSHSPSLAEMRSRLHAALPKAQWFEYEALSDDNAREGARMAFGRPLRGTLDLAEARIVVALDADLFGGGSPLAVKHARDFAAGRRLYEETARTMNRLYVAESIHSTTGACADHRLAVRPGAIAALAAQIAAAVGVSTPGLTGQQGATGKLPEPAPGTGETPVAPVKDFLDRVVADLKENGGHSVVVAGQRQPAAVHALVAAINHKLGSVGRIAVYYPDPDSAREPHPAAMKSLVDQMQRGEVTTLLILGGNPVYDAPADLQFAAALGKVPDSIHLALHDDETSQLCMWHLSRAHYLEAWGDVRTHDGTVSIVQPLIEPLFDGRSAIDVLALILDDKTGIDGGGQAIVRRTLSSLLKEPLTDWKWKQALVEGVVEGTAWKSVAAGELKRAAEYAGAGNIGALKGTVPFSLRENRGTPDGDVCDVVFFSDGKVYDGRFANIGWLQELPDPMTRLTWDNAALMSPQTAAALGVRRDELVALETPAAEPVALPAFFLPGMPDGVIGLALGYGRESAGGVGQAVGQNAYRLRTSDGLGWRAGVRVRPTGQTARLATVQDHHVVDAGGRGAVQQRIPVLIREGDFQQYRRDPAVGIEKTGELSIFDEHRFDGRVDGHAGEKDVPAHDFHKWGMAIDLTACTGCGACVVACQAENNIPIVGKEQVLHGREMHWIRVDRYFRETPEAPVAVHQPVLCMHCENAPCEEVCPVAATTHSQEGVNMMVYNRCVGTRYCSNNCPYKVRRFNFFDYNSGTLKDHYVPNLARGPVSELLKMQKNPDVTVRTRGVMEKCTFCIQRIEQARIAAKREGNRPLRDGEMKTACQQTCPTQAIVFGDLNDPESRVSTLQALARSYGMLDAELNTKPRTRYLARLRNPATLEDPGVAAGAKPATDP
jgi:Fe-S-cluster-containing dehydrogenase component/anaerobic selenocysteine-containing dehydrogenase